MPNSRLQAAGPQRANPATAGLGRQSVAEIMPAVSGVDGDAAVDFPSAYVELFSKSTGQSLGTYLVSNGLREQPVEVDGRTYDLALRFERIYYPFTLTLENFSFDRYMGTNTAKNYSSEVQLRDPTRNVDRPIVISMNNPLRYSDLTFYQASFDAATERTTVLQVVQNAGWMIPYVACMLVLTGMVAHFGVGLTRFSRRLTEESARRRAGDSGPVKGTVLVPVIVVLLAAAFSGWMARMPDSKPSEMRIYEFAKLPLAYQGRIKPYDTLARNMLQIISGKQQVSGEQDGKKTRQPAIRWLLDVISGAEAASQHRVFRIENLELLAALGLEPREGSFRYSLADLRDGMTELDKQIKLASAQPEGGRSVYQNHVLQLAKKLNLYAMLRQSFLSPQIRPDRETFAQDIRQVQLDILRLRESMAPRAVPPRVEDPLAAEWKTLLEAELDLLRDRVTGQPVNPATVSLGTLLTAYAGGDVATFNRQLAEYRRELSRYDDMLAGNSTALRKAGLKKGEIFSQVRADFENFFNQFSPFVFAALLYFMAFVLGFLSWLVWTEPLRRASFWLIVFTFAMHTLALVGRIYISGRPPVTNLYSSAVFIGWGCVLLAIVLEAIYELGLGNIVAAVVGFLTLLVAHYLSLDGDTMIVMQAVLDTQFWLSTHVLCIALGYATTFAAGALGVLYVLLVHVFDQFDTNDRRQLARMTYGTLCFAIFFSFIGTVLGGLWADNSWGRFWGWDPKENGALIIVLYIALVLHARWGGLVKGRGLALLAIGGNIVTTWSWFGVNELGVGLHSYGASESSTAMWLLTFAASQLVLIALGMTPENWWRPRSTVSPR
jgi:ABC-type transport system involved in cytochrome c biogenesis permease subunit